MDNNFAMGLLVPTAIFTLTDGSKIEFAGVNVDSIGPSASNPGVVAIEFEDDYDRLVHVPFVRFWEIQYRRPGPDPFN